MGRKFKAMDALNVSTLIGLLIETLHTIAYDLQEYAVLNVVLRT